MLAGTEVTKIKVLSYGILCIVLGPKVSLLSLLLVTEVFASSSIISYMNEFALRMDK